MNRTTWIMLGVLVFFGLIALFVHRPTEAEMYKYVGKDGKIHFTNDRQKADAGGEEVETVENRGLPEMKTIRDGKAGSGEAKTAGENSKAGAKSEKKVIIYMTDWCGYCRRTMAWLDKQGIPYEAKNIEMSREAHQEYMRKGGDGGVPLVDVNGTIIMGFNPDRMLRAWKN